MISKFFDGLFFLFGCVLVIKSYIERFNALHEESSMEFSILLYMVVTTLAWIGVFYLAIKIRNAIKPDFVMASSFSEMIKVQLGFQYLPLLLALLATINIPITYLNEKILEEKHAIEKDKLEKEKASECNISAFSVFETNLKLLKIKGFKGKQILNGIVECTDDNGVVLVRGEFNQGKRDGTFEEFYSENKLRHKVSWKNDKKNGVERYNYPNGSVESETNWNMGIKDGQETKWFKNSIQGSLITWVDGKKNGIETIASNNGKIIERRHWKNDLKDGLEEIFNSSGEILERRHWKNDLKDGLEEIFNSEGRLIKKTNWTEGKKDGTEESWYTNGKQEFKRNWKSGRLDGKETQWHDNGNLSLKILYKADQETKRKVFKYYSDGSKFHIVEYIPKKGVRPSFARHGVKHGKSVGYFSGTNQKAFVEHYKNGNRHGEKIAFHRNGKISLKAHYVNGVKNGESISYYKSGKPKSLIVYKNGRQISYKKL